MQIRKSMQSVEYTDITLQKELLHNAIRNEELLKEAQTLAHLGNWSHDLISGQVSWSDEHFRLFGYQLNSIVPGYEHFINAVHPDDRDMLFTRIDNAIRLNKNETYSVEFRVLINTKIRYLSTRFQVEFDATGKALRRFGTSMDITDRKLVEQDLLKSRALHESAQQLVSLGHWELQHKGIKKLFWSDQVYTIFELDKSCFNPSYDKLFDAIHPEDREQTRKAFTESVTNHSQYNIIHRLLMQDGRIKFVQEIGSTSYNDAGEALTTIGTVQDITAIHKAALTMQQAYAELQLTLDKRSDDLSELSEQVEQGVLKHMEMVKTLRDERDFVKSLIDIAQVIILVLDKDGRIVRFNPYLTSLTGYSLSETRGKNWFETFIPDIHHSSLKRLFNMSVAGAKVRGNVNPILTKDGAERIIEWWSDPMLNVYGESSGLLAIGQDITQHQQIINELETERLLLRTLIEESSSIICYKNRQGRWYVANKAILNLFGLHNIQYKGMSNQHMFELVDPVVRDAFETCIGWEEDVWKNRAPITKDLKIPQADGSNKIYQITKKLLYNQLNKAEAILVIGHDITDREIAKRQRLAEMRQQKNSLVREVHHRIKNHLQGLKGLLNLHKNNNPEYDQALNEAISQINSIAVVYGLQSQNQDTSIYFYEMLGAIIEDIEKLDKLDLALILDPQQINFQIDANQAVALSLVINELLMNALKHRRILDIDAGVDVQVSSRSEGEVTFLYIENNGVLPQGFNFQAGTGLGTGLELVKTMLPSKGASLRLFQQGDRVEAELELCAPLIKQQAVTPGSNENGENND